MVFKVDEIEAINFDENGKEDGTWKGFSVVKDGDEANYCFDMRDKLNADRLCRFLNEECIVDTGTDIEAFVLDNCIEWGNLISELSQKEIKLLKAKAHYETLSDNIIDTTDFKGLYGKNNADIRKKHVKELLQVEYDEIKELEFSIDYLKRRLTYLKGIVTVKTALLETKG